ncbi:hypothetical protein [Sulfurimonas sp.]
MKYLIGSILIIVLAFSACSQKSVEYGTKGALAGGVGSAFVGALTDIVLDGKINSSTLTRNLVSGAIAGATTGAIVGSNSKKETKKVESKPTEELMYKEKIGSENYTALNHLVECRNNVSYRITIKTESSQNKDYKLAAYAIQALNDKDRKNEIGITQSINKFIALSDKIRTKDTAKIELDKLYSKLLNERRVRGIICNNN